ncbi:MAG: exo-alpha-sialidase [Planctomycetes bacterium]|nr:exo-alpha-sialidase [Planctomycetota bacterium]
MREHFFRMRARGCAGVILLTAAAHGQVETPLEIPVLPDGLPAATAESAPGFARVPGLDNAGSVQVNVTAAGNNIVGDAANEPSIAVDPTAPNRMAIGWRQFDTISSSFRQAGWAWTNDGGRTWTFPGRLTPGIFRSDPVLDADAMGNFYYYSLKGDFFCDVFTSDDGGETWSGPTPSFGGDKAWMTIDQTAGIGKGNIYVAWSTAGNPFFPNQFTRSTNAGLNWLNPIEFPGPRPIWGTLDYDRAGNLFISGRSGSSMRLVKSANAQDPGALPSFDFNRSVDLGGTIGFRQPINPAGLTGQNWVAVDRSGGPHDGNIYMLASVVPSGGGDPMEVMFVRSTNGGLSFSSPMRVNDDPAGNWNWFGTMSVAPNGRIDVVWYDTRNAPGGGFDSELFYSFSDDGGLTWSPSQAMSTSFNPHLGWPQQNKLGDYIDMTSDLVGANLAWAATFTGGQDVYYLRIGDYDCNGNGIGDEIDLQSGFALDCNTNGIPDSCEIAAGAVPDLNGNGIPDPCECYADCDPNGVLDIFDFLCFQNSFVAGEPYACDCDPDPACDIFDFLCFQDAFVAGCP